MTLQGRVLPIGGLKQKVLVLTPTGARLRALLIHRMTAPPASLERLSLREQRALVRLLARLLE